MKMNLKQHLSIENPSLDQLIETEVLLHTAIDKASSDLIALDAEDRGQAANRLRGVDDGAEARRVARADLERDRSDAAEVLVGIQSSIAKEKARQDAVIEAEAWDRTWGHLARRRAAMTEIEGLCDKIAGLHGEMTESYNHALDAAPKKPEERAWTTPAHYVADVSRAIVVALNARLGYPMKVGELSALELALRVHGLPAYLNASEDRVMLAPVLNRDGKEIAA
jgi:hypothetical protein